MITLAQLTQPQGVDYWNNVLLQSLQGIGYITQSGPTSQLLGTGTITATGPATQAASVVVKISTTGNVGTGYFIYSTDGGITFSSPTLIPTGASSSSGNFIIAAIGVTLTFTNGAYISPNATGYFVAGEQYAFNTAVPTFPVTNWEPGAPARSLIAADAQALTDLDLTQSQVAAAGFTQSWITPPPWGAPPSGWLDLLSQNFYNRTRIQGLPTQGIVQLSNSGTAAQSIPVGGLLLQSATGQKFTNVTGGSLPGASGGHPGTLNVTVQAVTAGASFNDIPTYVSGSLIPGGNYLTTLVSPSLPGVSVTNPINNSPACVHTGSGPASINFTGTASIAFNLIVLITTNGAVGTSTYSTSTDGGNTYTAQGVTVGSGGFAYEGMTLAFPAGTYVAGATYSFSTGWITQYGSDTQTDVSLATADQNQWTQLAPSSPAGTYKNWALAASSEVVNAFVTASTTVPGQVNVLLVGPNNGPVSVAAIAAVTEYIQQRLGINDSVLVATVFPSTITVQAGSGGTIQIHSSQIATAYASVAAALFAYQESIPPGGTVIWSAIVAAINGAQGVIQVIPPLNINGAENDIPLLPNEVPVIVPPPSGSYTPV